MFVSSDVIETLKEKAKLLGYSINYRNRNGKQYLTCNKCSLEDIGFIRESLPEARITSGNAVNITFRINPGN